MTIEEEKKSRKKYMKEYQQNNKEKFAKNSKKWRDKNPENGAEYIKKWREVNPEYQRDYQKNNKGIVNAKTARRRATKKNATPSWANLELIKEFYKKCPAGFEVDHIIPLKGRTVCGLHVESNLQYLTIEENRGKSNKLVDNYN